MLAQLGDLPPLKRHCGKLAELALQAAIGDYYTKSKGDKTLSENVTRRIRDPREWAPELPADSDMAAMMPL